MSKVNRKKKKESTSTNKSMPKFHLSDHIDDSNVSEESHQQLADEMAKLSKKFSGESKNIARLHESFENVYITKDDQPPPKDRWYRQS